MAEQDVFPTYYGGLLPYYTGLGGGKGDRPGGPPTPDPPDELLTGIGNWADFCTAIRGDVVRHPNEPIDNFPDNKGAHSGDWEKEAYDPLRPPPNGPSPVRQADDNRPQNLPMLDLTIDSFFDAANMLTGGDLSGIDKLWTLLRDDHNGFLQEQMSSSGSGGVGPNVFFATVEHILDDWSGDAQKKAALYAAGLKDAFESQIRITGWLSDALMAYTGIVVGARRQMLDLMRAFRETMRNKERTSAQDDRNFTIGLLATVVSSMVTAGVAIMTVETGLGVALMTQFVTGCISLTNQALSHAKPADGIQGDDYADIAVSYLQKAGDIVLEAKNALRELINGVTADNPMTHLALDKSWAPVPPPLIKDGSDPSAVDKL